MAASPLAAFRTSVIAGRLPDSWRAMRDVFQQPRLRWAELAFLSACASETAFTVALGVIAFRDGGPAAVGLIGVLRMLPSAVGTPFLSAFADRYRREQVIIAASVVRSVAVGGAAVSLQVGAPTATVYALAVPATIASTVFRPGHSALLPSLCTTAPQLTSANIVRGLLEALATLVGPGLAGILLATAGDATVLATIAALSLAAAGFLLALRYEAPARSLPAHRPRLRREAAEGARAVAGNRDLRLVFGLGFAQTCVRGALNVFVVVVAFRLLRTGDSGAAGLSAAVGVGGLVGSFGVSLLVGSRRLGGWLGIALVLWGAPIALIGAVPAPVAVLALLAVVGLANAIIDVPVFTLPVRLASDAVLARAFGVFESLVALGVALGSAVTPALIAVLGLRGALVAVGSTLPLLGVLTLRRLAELDRRLEVRDAEIDVLRANPMFGRLPVPGIEHLASALRRRSFRAGAVLFRQGDPGGSFYLVTEGEAEVVGDGAVVRMVGPGGWFGEIALIRDVPRTATVRARGDLGVFEIGRDDFLQAVGGYRATSDAAQAAVARQLAHFTPAAL